MYVELDAFLQTYISVQLGLNSQAARRQQCFFV